MNGKKIIESVTETILSFPKPLDTFISINFTRDEYKKAFSAKCRKSLEKFSRNYPCILGIVIDEKTLK